MPKTKWDVAEEPTINNVHTIVPENLEYALKMRIARSRQQYYMAKNNFP